MDTAQLQRPPHVPEALVYDYDLFTAVELKKHPHRDVARRLHNNAPDIFYSTRHGGYWVVTRADIARDILHQTDKFSSDPEFNVARQFYPKQYPIQLGPPDHAEYRKILNPYFVPGAILKMEQFVRGLAREIIGDIKPKGGCEFVHEVALRYPVTIFLHLVGAPAEDRHLLSEYAELYARSPDFAERQRGITGLCNYMAEQYDLRRKQPGADMLSHVLASKVYGRTLTKDEEIGIGTLLFLAGLDTVKSTLSFLALFLAEHTAQYDQLAADSELIPHAIEELLRVSAVTTPERGVTHDLEYRDIRFKKGDRIMLMTQLFGMDERLTADPERVDFDREVSQHLTFGSGAHRCIGSHLARLEIRVFLEEWIKAFPRFGIKPGASVEVSGGFVWSPVSLPLAWPLS